MPQLRVFFSDAAAYGFFYSSLRSLMKTSEGKVPHISI
jgi:hypothetical protein